MPEHHRNPRARGPRVRTTLAVATAAAAIVAVTAVGAPAASKPSGSSPAPSPDAVTLAAVAESTVTQAPAAAARAALPPAPSADASLDAILRALATYDGGIESAAVWRLDRYVREHRDHEAGRLECETKLIAFLTSTATAPARMAAARQLRTIASDGAAAALGALALDARTSDLAIYVLQPMPGQAADRALLAALPKSTGATRIAVVAALGERGTRDAVPALIPLLRRPDTAVVAATALGAIGDAAAADALVAARAAARGETASAMASAVLRIAERRAAARDASGALRLYEPLASDSSLAPPLRRAAAIGRLASAGGGAPSLLLEWLAGADAVLRDAAIATLGSTITADQVGSVVAALPGLPDEAKVPVIAALTRYPANRILPALGEQARSGSLPVRLAAIDALGAAGDASVVGVLVDRAAATRGAEQAAARAALGALKGRAVDEAILASLARRPGDATTFELLAAVADRRLFDAKPAVAAALSDAAVRVRVQALRTLRVVGTPSDVPAVLDRILEAADEREQDEAEATIVALARKNATESRRSAAVRSRLADRPDPPVHARLLGVLALIGDTSSLPLVRAALADPSPEVFDAAVRALAAWPTVAARDDVRRLAREARLDIHRLLAIGGLVRLVTIDRFREPRAAVADLAEAAACAWRPEEQRQVLAALAQFPCREALELAQGYLRDPAVEAEAQVAVEALTERLERRSGRIASISDRVAVTAVPRPAGSRVLVLARGNVGW